MIGIFVVSGLSVLVVFLYRQWYDPNIPRGYHNPNALRAVHFFMKIVHMWVIAISFAAVYKAGLQCILRSLVSGTYIEHLKSCFEVLGKKMSPKIPEHEKNQIKTQDTKFNGVDVRIYTRGDHKEQMPSIIIYHGGGWALGSLDSYNIFCRKLAKEMDVILVSVGYRLADTTKGIKFPIPMQDCVDATKHFLTNASHYGGDPCRVAVMGDSAGGNLAAAVSLKLRDENFLPVPKLQVLIYPALQCVNLSTPSYQQNKDGLCLSEWFLGQCWSLYITGSDRYGDDILANRHVPDHYKKILTGEAIDRKYHYAPYQQRSVSSDWPVKLSEFADLFQNPYCVPLMAENLKNLPDAYIFTAQHDVLRDDGLLYVKRLREAGVKVTHQHSDIGFHGIISMFHIVPEAHHCLQQMTCFITEQL